MNKKNHSEMVKIFEICYFQGKQLNSYCKSGTVNGATFTYKIQITKAAPSNTIILN